MNRFSIAWMSILLLAIGAASPAVLAQRRECTIEVTPRSETNQTVYEVSGEGFAPGEEIRIEAVNRRTSQGYIFFVTPTTARLSGVVIGKDPDGFFYHVPPGSWKVEAKGGGCKTKTSFALSAVPIGLWGGEQVQLETSVDGAKLTARCASGTIDEPLVPDVDGVFNAKGSLILDGPGPTRRFESAHYKGQTDGSTMTLTVTVEESSAIRLIFNVTFGKQVQVDPCPLV